MPESSYEKARRLASENSLPGVDWDSMRDPKYDTLPDTLKPEAFEAEKESWRLKQYHQDPEVRTRSISPWGYIDRPGDYEQEEINASRQKLAKIAIKKPFPEGMKMAHTVERGTWGGAAHSLEISDPNDSTEGNVFVGRLTWDGTNGHVDGFHVDENYRHLAPHMLEAAHSISSAYGHVGPTNSNDLSPYSYKLSRRYAPSSMPYDAAVSGISVEHYEDPHYEEHEELGHTLSNIAGSAYDLRYELGGHPSNYDLTDAVNSLSKAEDAHSDYDHSSVKDYLHEAKTHIANAAAGIKPENHSDSETMRGFLSRTQSLHDTITDTLEKHKVLFD
jgi:hypothetical protein